MVRATRPSQAAPWEHPNAASGAQIREASVQWIRHNAIQAAHAHAHSHADANAGGGASAPPVWMKRSVARVEDAGWHLSYFMTVQEIVAKLHSFSHTECVVGWSVGAA